MVPTRGMRIETHEIATRRGAVWRFDIVAPDGRRFLNPIAVLRVETLRVIEGGRGADTDNDGFRLPVTFDEQDSGKTVVAVCRPHPSQECRAIVVGFGAVEVGARTPDGLADHLAATPGAAAPGR